MFKPIAAYLMLLSIVLPAFAQADETRNTANYQITLSGIPLANAHFQAKQDGKTYSIDAQLATTSLADIIAPSKAEMSSRGLVKNDRWEPANFFFRYKSGKRSRRFETTFNGGAVTDSLIGPKQRRKKNWIPTTPGDLRAVTDPMAGLVIPADRDPCEKSVAVYDGEARLDLRLAPKRTDTYTTEGFSGPVVVCSLRYEPKSGYRKGHKDIDYVRKLKNIEIWFAKAGPMNVYAPVYLSVPTSYGPLTIKATHFDG